MNYNFNISHIVLSQTATQDLLNNMTYGLKHKLVSRSLNSMLPNPKILAG